MGKRIQRLFAGMVAGWLLALSGQAAAQVPVRRVNMRITKAAWPQPEFGYFLRTPNLQAVITVNGTPLPVVSLAWPCGVLEGCASDLDGMFEVSSSFDLPLPLGAAANVHIELWEQGSFGAAPHDLDPGLDDGLDLRVDPNTGAWSGEVPGSQSCSTGAPARICWVLDRDSDNDGLFDAWEQRGYDADGDGDVDLDFPAMGASPQHKDMFVQLDHIAGQAPTRATLEAVRIALGVGPADATGVTNPDGLDGIRLHVDAGELPDAEGLVGDALGARANRFGRTVQPGTEGCGVSDPLFRAIKNANFPAARLGLFHYGIVGVAGCDMNGDGRVDGGIAEVGGDDLVVAAPGSNPRFAPAGLLHELGHNLGLRHGGDEPHNCKPNYLSVMNYYYAQGFPLDRPGETQVLLDFSPPLGANGRLPLFDLDENHLDEVTALAPREMLLLLHFADQNRVARVAAVRTNIDWTGDGVLGVDQQVNLDLSPRRRNGTVLFPGCDIGAPQDPADNSEDAITNEEFEVLTSSNDWSTMNLHFRAGAFTPGTSEFDGHDLTPEEMSLNDLFGVSDDGPLTPDLGGGVSQPGDGGIGVPTGNDGVLTPVTPRPGLPTEVSPLPALEPLPPPRRLE